MDTNTLTATNTVTGRTAACGLNFYKATDDEIRAMVRAALPPQVPDSVVTDLLDSGTAGRGAVRYTLTDDTPPPVGRELWWI